MGTYTSQYSSRRPATGWILPPFQHGLDEKLALVMELVDASVWERELFG